MVNRYSHDPSTRLRRKRLLLTLVGALGFSVLWNGVAPTVVNAHAIVTSTEPAIDETLQEPPSEVVMRFNEPVEAAFGAIRVYDTDARRVDTGETEHLEGQSDAIQVALKPDLPVGTYTVTWRVLSADGHPISEAFVFHVGHPGEHPEGIASQLLGSDGADPTAATLYGVARWLNFMGLLFLTGAILFSIVVWSRGAGGPLSSQVSTRFATAWWKVAISSWALVLVATAASYVFQGAVAGGFTLRQAITGDVLGQVADTRLGTVSFVRIALLVAALPCLVAIRGRMRSAESASGTDGPTIPHWLGGVAALICAALLATPGVAGHAGSTPPIALNLAADIVHMIAAAMWIGGLLLLTIAVFPAVRGTSDATAVGIVAPVVSRFSRLAVWAVVAIVVTGTYRAWTEVGAWRGLTGATYGWVLLAKIAVFLPLLGLGAINNRWTMPRLGRALESGEGSGASMGTLRRLVATEVTLAVIVLGITSFLVNLPPARVAAGVTGPFVTDVRLGPYQLNVLIDPNEIGENEVHLTATQDDGTPAPIKAVDILFRMPEENIGPLHGHGTELAPGHFVVQGHELSVPGQWQIEVVARITRFDEERSTFSFTVNR